MNIAPGAGHPLNLERGGNLLRVCSLFDWYRSGFSSSRLEFVMRDPAR